MSWTRGRPPTTRASRAQTTRILQRDPICRCEGCPRCTPRGCNKASEQKDHIIPWSRGGSEDDSNMRGICRPCHGHKTRVEAASRTLTTKRPTERHPGAL